MTISFGSDPIVQEVTRALSQLEAGNWAGQESARVDLKEEAGRRDRAGRYIQPLAPSRQKPALTPDKRPP